MYLSASLTVFSHISVCPCTRLSVYLFILLSIHASVCHSINPPDSLAFRLSIRLLIYLSVCSVYLHVCLSFHLSVCHSIYPSVCLSVHPYVCLLFCLSVCYSVYPSVCHYVYLSVCLSVIPSSHQSVCRLLIDPSVCLLFCRSVIPTIHQSVCLCGSSCYQPTWNLLMCSSRTGSLNDL